MTARFTRPAHRISRITAVALIGAIATCVEQPISPRDQEIADPSAAATIADSSAAALPVAAAITHKLLTSGNHPVNQKVYTTAPISPSPNALVTVAVMGHNATSATPSPTLSGGGMSAWTVVATITFDDLSTPHKRLTIFRAMSASPGSGPLTITFSNSQSHCQWIVSQWEGVDNTGMNGAGAIVQTGSTRAGAVNGLAVTLGAFGAANNVAYGVFGVRSSVLAVTPGAGFTEIAEHSSGESPPSDLQAEWAAGDNTIDARWANLSGAALGVEIKAATSSAGVSASQSTVTASASSIPAGSGAATITVTAKDDAGNPVSGATVVLSATGSGNTLTQPAGPTGADGVATGTFSSTVAETKTISATTNGTALTQTATVEVTAHTASAITHTLLTSGNNTVNQSVYTTASISPAPNALVTVAVLGHNATSAAPSPTLSGGGMSAWTEVATITFDPLSTPLKRLTIFRAMSASPGSGPLTITWSKAQSNCEWIVSQWVGVDNTGVNGAGAIVQTGSTRAAAASGLTVALGAFGHPNNVAYGIFGVRSSTAAVSPGTGFTEIAERPSAESPPSDLQAEWATNDHTIDARWVNLSGAALGVEIKAGNTGPVTPVASVEVIPGSASVAVGGTVQLSGTARNAQGQPLTGRTFTWETDAPGVATVSAAGLVTGVAEGLVTITATSEGKSGTASVTVTSLPTSAVMGEWSSVMPAPIVQVHLNLLLDGRVLSWGHQGHPQVWNPATGLFTPVPSPSLLFCAGHDFLPDGRLLVAGGHITPSHGLPDTNIFDFATSSWQVGAPMALGRWYPTITMLPNGEVLTIAGEDQDGKTVAVPEIWNGTSWRQLTGASLTLLYYPRTFVAPDGRVFYAGPQPQSLFLNLTGAGSWSPGPTMKFGLRWYAPAVMYEPGKILYVGGNSAPTNTAEIITNTAEIIDLNQPNPQWNYTGSMSYGRWNTNATILPTGEVLVTGGVSGDRGDPALAVNTTELWNPANGTWRTLARSAALLRGYHSTSLLLPDGRLLHAGGGEGAGTPDNRNYELYSPPYLFRGARPTVTGATPGVVAYGQTLFLETPDGASITKVSLIRFGSVTHSIDMGQRLVPLNFTQTGGGLSVNLPASRTAAPPGPYMLFLVNGSGVPSVARIMRLN